MTSLSIHLDWKNETRMTSFLHQSELRCRVAVPCFGNFWHRFRLDDQASNWFKAKLFRLARCRLMRRVHEDQSACALSLSKSEHY